MGANGIDEHYITGSASDEKSFGPGPKRSPKTLRNPLYHWTHLELKKPFGITDVLLDGDTAEEIYASLRGTASRG